MADGGAASRPPAPGIWTFIAADCAGFAVFFMVFMAERAKSAALFDASARRLDVGTGLVNTLILVTSSWLVALAVHAADRGRPARAARLLLGGLCVAACFGALKVAEYVGKIGAGITPATNDFFMFYFILTGVHFLHYLIGIGVLAMMLHAVARAGRGAGGQVPWLESGALYWHMVDLLWLFLFPMLYLLGGR